jgi:selenocysteine lyase/cysteine desulfurase
LASVARRFDMSASWLLNVGLRAALRDRSTLDYDATLSRVADIAQFMRREAVRLQLPYLFADDRRAAQQQVPIMSIVVGERDATLLSNQLKTQYNVMVSARDGFVRISAHFYNSEAEITLALEQFKRLLCSQ